MFVRRVAVIGTGLIGGSIGLGIRALYPALPVVGYDDDPTSLGAALQRGALSAAAASPREAAAGAELIVLATPVDRIGAAIDELRDVAPEDATVTDVGSAKSTVVERGEAAVGERFVGGHPMAGSERHGIEAADGRLFQDSWWVLTPTAATSSRAYSTVSAMVRLLGAKAIAVDPVAHDALVARLSHLPQLTASALVDVAAAAGDREALLGLAAAGFRDVTRIAASNPSLWVAIVRTNASAVLAALGTLKDKLSHMERLVADARWDELEAILDRARRARLELFAKPSYGGEPISLALLVPDRPGTLAEVTTAAGKLGVNIEDLRIVHSTEGGRGRLEVIVAGKESAETLVGALEALGYHVERTLD